MVENFVNNYIENVWVEEEVARWMKKQMALCLRREDKFRTTWYGQKMWESDLGRRCFDEGIDKASRELNELMRGRRESGESWIPWVVRCFPWRMAIYPLGEARA